MSNANLDEFVKLGAAWKNHDSQGRLFLSTDIYLGGRKLIIFKNLFKEEGSQQPDFQIFLAPLPDDKRGGEGGTARRERYEDELGDIPAGAGDTPQDGLYAPVDESLAPPPRVAVAPPQQDRRGHGGVSVPSRSGQRPYANTNDALGGQATANRARQPQPANDDELTDPFAE